MAEVRITQSAPVADHECAISTSEQGAGKNIPIIFSAPMVSALLDGRKTQTRRIAWHSETDKKKMSFLCDGERPNPLARKARGFGVQMGGEYWLRPTPWVGVKPGDGLWVRETFCYGPVDDDPIYYRATDQVQSVVDGDGFTITNKDGSEKSPWRSPLHMPRWASRLTLIVTATKVERLQDISEADAKAEGLEWVSGTYGIKGIAATWVAGARGSFSELWKHLHGPDAWDANPEVVAIAFRVVKANIDAVR